MKVWALSHDVDDGDQGHDEVYAVFATEEAARASMAEDDGIEDHDVRVEPLRTETRYRARGDGSHPHESRNVLSVTPFTVNELDGREFGAGVLEERYGWWSMGRIFTAPTEAEAREALEKAMRRR